MRNCGHPVKEDKWRLRDTVTSSGSQLISVYVKLEFAKNYGPAKADENAGLGAREKNTEVPHADVKL